MPSLDNVELIDGVLGLEAKHAYTPADIGAFGIVMNDCKPDRSTFPRSKFKSMPGFKSSPDAENNSVPNGARPGVTPLVSLVRGKTFNVRMLLQTLGRTPKELRQLESAYSAAFGERSIPGVWSVIPQSEYGDDTNYWFGKVRITGWEPEEELTSGPTARDGAWQMPALLSCFMPDPRWYWTEVATEGPDALSVVCNNEGWAWTDPTLVIDFSGDGDLDVYNDTLVKRLSFKDFHDVIGPITINFGKRTCTDSDDSNLMPYFDDAVSDWWDRATPGMRSGNNTLRQVGGDAITAYWRHAAWA